MEKNPKEWGKNKKHICLKLMNLLGEESRRYNVLILICHHQDIKSWHQVLKINNECFLDFIFLNIHRCSSIYIYVYVNIETL